MNWQVCAKMRVFKSSFKKPGFEIPVFKNSGLQNFLFSKFGFLFQVGNHFLKHWPAEQAHSYEPCLFTQDPLSPQIHEIKTG